MMICHVQYVSRCYCLWNYIVVDCLWNYIVIVYETIYTWCRFILKVFMAAIYKTRKNKTILLVIYSFDEIIYLFWWKNKAVFKKYYYSFIYLIVHVILYFSCQFYWLIVWFVYLFITSFLFISVFNYFLHTLFYLFGHELIWNFCAFHQLFLRKCLLCDY